MSGLARERAAHARSRRKIAAKQALRLAGERAILRHVQVCPGLTATEVHAEMARGEGIPLSVDTVRVYARRLVVAGVLRKDGRRLYPSRRLPSGR